MLPAAPKPRPLWVETSAFVGLDRRLGVDRRGPRRGPWLDRRKRSAAAPAPSVATLARTLRLQALSIQTEADVDRLWGRLRAGQTLADLDGHAEAAAEFGRLARLAASGVPPRRFADVLDLRLMGLLGRILA